MFASREQGGQKLGQYLKQQGVHADLVLGLPRGGVVVAAGVAHELDLPLDVSNGDDRSFVERQANVRQFLLGCV